MCWQLLVLYHKSGRYHSLVGMNKVQCDHVELEPVGNHLFDELADGIQEHNQPERLWCGIGWFSRFRDYY